MDATRTLRHAIFFTMYFCFTSPFIFLKLVLSTSIRRLSVGCTISFCQYTNAGFVMNQEARSAAGPALRHLHMTVRRWSASPRMLLYGISTRGHDVLCDFVAVDKESLTKCPLIMPYLLVCAADKLLNIPTVCQAPFLQSGIDQEYIVQEGFCFRCSSHSNDCTRVALSKVAKFFQFAAAAVYVLRNVVVT